MLIHDIYVLGESPSFELESREEATINLELRKVPPCYHTFLSGKVIRKDLPIRKAIVLVLDDNCNPVTSTITDEDGCYSFRNNLKPGTYKVIASAIGYCTSDIKVVQIIQNEVTRLSFSLKRCLISVNGLIYGKILEVGNRKPIEAADICLKSLDTDEIIYKTASNHHGQYLIYNILPNHYKMVIQKKGYLDTEPLVIKVEKYDRLCLNFDLIRDSNDCKGSICGRITSDGKSISKAVVFLYLLENQENEKLVQLQETNENGVYLFSNVESGTYLVRGKLQTSVIYEKSFVIE